MARLTISLPNELHRALKEAVARQDTSIGELIAESLVAYGVKPRAAAEDLVRRAREQAGLAEREAMRLAQAETLAARRARVADGAKSARLGARAGRR
jgi:hypothetical protein